ncbi:MaoC/PaaZ C-terminal domain-containing protein [Flexivirga meconopsidis]|uniref:MaoC/PaaZ C-terminal domain-containing protein n=1 Tax=Flexivirga meconopsidis TaxID=2977121 RepID=UPI00223FD2A8|nr:MaoC/PaaZ C-terminal domain-containing protein [Flexivirga meconopsidis]
MTVIDLPTRIAREGADAELETLLGAEPGRVELLRAFIIAHPHIGRLVEERFAAHTSLVHLDQQIELHVPSLAGREIRVTAEAAPQRPHPTGTTVALQATLTDIADGTALASLHGTVLLAGITAEPVVAAAPRHQPAAASGEPRVRHVGVGQNFISAYARISGDDNPIHLVPKAARAAGFEGTIAHGMSIVGLVLARAPRRATAVGVRFAQPVVVDDIVRLSIGRTVDPGEFRVAVASERGPVIKAGWLRVSQEAVR